LFFDTWTLPQSKRNLTYHDHDTMTPRTKEEEDSQCTESIHTSKAILK